MSNKPVTALTEQFSSVERQKPITYIDCPPQLVRVFMPTAYGESPVIAVAYNEGGRRYVIDFEPEKIFDHWQYETCRAVGFHSYGPSSSPAFYILEGNLPDFMRSMSQKQAAAALDYVREFTAEILPENDAEFLRSKLDTAARRIPLQPVQEEPETKAAINTGSMIDRVRFQRLQRCNKF